MGMTEINEHSCGKYHQLLNPCRHEKFKTGCFGSQQYEYRCSSVLHVLSFRPGIINYVDNKFLLAFDDLILYNQRKK